MMNPDNGSYVDDFTAGEVQTFTPTFVDTTGEPVDESIAWRSGAQVTSFDTASSANWLDAVPGARAAYDYMRQKISEFNVIGLKTLPGYTTLLQVLGPRVQSTNDPMLQQLYRDASGQTSSLRSSWESIDVKLRQILAQLNNAGLGFVPIAVAGAIVAVVGSMYVFFGASARNEEAIRLLVTKAVERGVLTVGDAERYLRGDGGGFGLGALGGGLGLVAIAALAIWFLPRRRSA